MDMSIAIKVDPQGALPAIKKVEGELSAAEKKAKDLERSMRSGMQGAASAFSSVARAVREHSDALQRTNDIHRQLTSSTHAAAQAFAKVAEAIQKHNTALHRTTEIHNQLATQNDSLVRSFGGLGEAIRRDTEMLERIHGPAREFAQDVMSLDRLLSQGKISAEQHALALHRMGAGYEAAARGAQHMTAAQKQQATQTIGLPGAPSRPSAMSGVSAGTFAAAAGVVGAPVAAVAGAAGYIEDKREEARSLKDEYIAMVNVAQKFADEEGRKMNEVLDEQLVISRELRQSFAPTVALYDDVGDATKDLNLTHSEHIRLMERLGKAAINESGDIGKAGEFMKRLAINMDAGRDSGRLLIGMMNELPKVTQMWTDKYGGDTQAFIKAVEDGKESYASLVDTIIAGSSGIEDAFARQRRSHAQWKTAVREEEIRVRFSEGIDPKVANTVARARVEGTETGFSGRKSAWRPSSNPADIVNDARARTVRQMTAAQEEADAKMAGNVLNALSGTVRDLGTQAALTSDQIDRKFNTALDDAATYSSSATVAIDEYAEAMKRIRGPQEEAIKQLNILGNLRMNDRITMEEYNRETERYRDLLLELGHIEIKSQTGGKIATPGIDLSGVATPLPGKSESSSTKGYVDMGLKANNQLKEDAKRASAETAQAWAEAGGQIAGSFARMAMEGEMSFGEMMDQMIEKAAMLTLQLAAAQIGGPGGAFAVGFVGSLFGGRNGFDHLIRGGGGLEMPGFALGGDAMIRGHGSQDTVPVAFWGSPGESLHVRTPQQRMAEQEWARDTQRARGGSGKQVTNVIVQSDPREVTAAMGTYEGKRAAVRLNRNWRR